MEKLSFFQTIKLQVTLILLLSTNGYLLYEATKTRSIKIPGQTSVVRQPVLFHSTKSAS